MGSILSAIGGLIGGNAGQQQGLGISENNINTNAANQTAATNAAITKFLALIQGQGANSALSGQYAPSQLNPNALAYGSAPQMGSVYSGFNPGQVPGITGGGASGPPGTSGAPPSYQWTPPSLPTSTGPSGAPPPQSPTGGASGGGVLTSPYLRGLGAMSPVTV
jgi:hypothetical protein